VQRKSNGRGFSIIGAGCAFVTPSRYLQASSVAVVLPFVMQTSALRADAMLRSSDLRGRGQHGLNTVLRWHSLWPDIRRIMH
jgi:NADH:ubiquinone oxidoreductase subunit F (NADH-binding)